MKIEERFHNALDRLYKDNFFLAEQVSKLGYPELVYNNFQTAGVQWDPKNKKIKFIFNANFADMITDEQFCFIVAHEAMHIINGHIFALKTEIDTLICQKKKKHIQEYVRNFGIAADCIVNDSLINLYNIPKIILPKIDKNNNKMLGIILYGQDVVKTDCHMLTIQNVIDLLPKSNNNIEHHDCWNSFFEKNGSINKNFTETIQNLIEDCSTNPSTSSKDYDVLDCLQDTLESCTDINAKKAGRSLKSGKKQINKIRAKISWDKLLSEKVDCKKTKEIWSRPARNMHESYPDIILPGTRERMRKKIFVAIDVSSSINRKIVDLFISVVKNTPPHIEIDAISFHTKCTPIDLNSDTIKYGGGTSFSIIEEYIQKKYKKYPEAVFVFTDGLGDYVFPQYPKKWCWLLYSTASIVYCTEMTHYPLEDLLNENKV